jgi:glutathione S-transferase
MVAYKFYYFDARGLGESIRLILHYVGQEFEDVRIKKEDWPNWKPKFAYGKVPVLEVEGGKQLAQSAAIARYLGEKYGIAGKDEWERAKVNEILDYFRDARDELTKYIYVVLGFREGDKEALRRDAFEPGVAHNFPIIERILKESGSGFLVASGVTFIDFIVAEFLEGVKGVEPKVLEAYPTLQDYVTRVHALPQLADYLKSRPQQ